MNNSSIIVIFDEAGFPVVDSSPVSRDMLESALSSFGECRFVGVDDLDAALAGQPALFITPHGSAFPKAAWIAFKEYLKKGGHWLNLGGAPVTRPVRRVGKKWQVESVQTSYGKELMIRHTFEVILPGGTTLTAPKIAGEGIEEIAGALQACPPTRAWALQVKLTNNSLLPDELGSAGTRDAILRPLAQAFSADGRNLVAPVVALDHINGAFTGGRWVLANCGGDNLWPQGLLTALVRQALVPVVQLEANADYACYSIGELPTIKVRAASNSSLSLNIGITVTNTDDGKQVFSDNKICKVNETLDCWISYPSLAGLHPGLYRIYATVEYGGAVISTAENGFWVEKTGQMAAPAPVVVDGDYFTRNGKPFPVTGTTYMSTVTHRSWMFEPTPIAWDRDFAAMKSAGVNMVRTGIWMGWKRAMIEPGAMDAGIVRSLRAFLLAAARHDIPVIMTLFAFLPETWGGVNPYLDQNAVRAQCNFATCLASGVADAPHLLWDLINEPSVAPTEHLWSCRPTYDRCEVEAWRKWLTDQKISDDEWRERWRLTPSDPLDLPKLDDFTDRHHWDNAKPLRCMDFVRFGQDIFTRWAETITAALRNCANPPQLVTVGQDEGGAYTSPSPHFHGTAVDFTSNHSWWQNDDLLWDAVITKLQGKPHLMEETGIMFAETADGLPVRSLEFVAGLLERKLALSFTCGGAGVIQWLWNTNVFLNSENEAGIGMLRADGSEKPELASFRRIASFMNRNAERMTGRIPEDVALIIPHSNLFSVRETAQAATRRAVRTLEYRLGIACRGVSEYFPEAIGDAKLIIVPSPRILRDECWQAILKCVNNGATLLVTGYSEADEYWRETARLAEFGIAQKAAMILHEESLTLDWNNRQTTLRAAMPIQKKIIPNLQKAVAPDGAPLAGKEVIYGKGRILFCPIPIEHSLAEEHTETVYRQAAEAAELICGKRPEFVDGGPGLLVRLVEFKDSALFIMINESNVEQAANLGGGVLKDKANWKTQIIVPANSAAMAFLDLKTGKVLDASR